MIKILMLDYNGVVGIWSESKYISNIAKYYFLSKRVVKKKMEENSNFDRAEAGEISYVDLHNIFCKEAGKNLPAKTYFKVVEGVYKDNKKMVSFLKEFKKKKVKIALAATANLGDYKWEKKKNESFKIFDYFFITSLMKVTKFDPKFFKRVINRLKVNPKEILYFDDNQKYVEIASKAGINSYVFTSFNEFKKIVEKYHENQY